MLGTKQSGLPEFRVARLPEDAELLERARACVDRAACARTRSSQTPSTRCCAPRSSGRFGALERRADRRLSARDAGRRRPVQGPAPRARRAAYHPPDRRTACARRSSACSARSTGCARARPLRRLGRARDRGALARGRGGDVRRLRRRPRSRAVRAEPRARRRRAARGSSGRTRSSFLRNAARHGERWDLAFCDPPYRLAHRLGGALEPLLAPVLGTRGAHRVRELASDSPSNWTCRSNASGATATRADRCTPHRSGALSMTPTDASRSAPGPTTRSPTATSTSSSARRGSSTRSSWAS